MEAQRVNRVMRASFGGAASFVDFAGLRLLHVLHRLQLLREGGRIHRQLLLLAIAVDRQRHGAALADAG
jgi:hypothetical protein